MNIITAHRTYKTPATAKRALEKVVADCQLNFEDVRWMIAVDNTGTDGAFYEVMGHEADVFAEVVR